MSDPDALRARAAALHLHGLLAHWPEVVAADWVALTAGLGGAGTRTAAAWSGG